MAKKTVEGFGGLKIAVDTFGSEDNPCVLLIPGGAQTRDVWSAAAQALAAAGRYVVAMDLRGHGESEWAADGRYDLDAFVGDLRQVLKSLSSRPVIVAASLGGWIATSTLGEGEPDMATGLVLVDSPAEVNMEESRKVGERLRRALAESTSNKFDPQIFSTSMLDDLASRLSAAAARIKLPCMIVRGTDSHISTPESAQKLAEQLNGAEVVEIANAGHLVAADQPDTFNAVMLDFLERKIPRTPPEYVTGSDPRTLRDALGCFATGVTVVTTTGMDGVPVGLTANSFTSVSLDPPLLLVCLANTANSLPVFRQVDNFAVNVLHIGQQPVSNLFAMKVEDRFAQCEWETWDHNVPIIKDALASFECTKYAEYDGGDHLILVGRVSRVLFEPRRDPLLYFRGKYRRLHFA